MNNIEMNKNTYEDKYSKGYGIQYPESHIIRIYEHYIKDIIGEKSNLLDYGCGNGTHDIYFMEKGINVCGVDISEKAIEICNKRIEDGKFYLVDKDNDLLKDIFNEKFDIIFANQVLYYLSDEELQKKLYDMNDVLNENGIVIFTMMSSENYYFKHAKKLNDNSGLYEVNLNGRLNETTYINFVKGADDLKEKFSMFNPLYIGKYDFDMKEGSSEHYFYIGKKLG